MNIYRAKKAGVTPSGSWYSILQDGPASFHMTVGKDKNVIYEHFENPPNIEFLDNNILLLEKELEPKTPWFLRGFVLYSIWTYVRGNYVSSKL